MTDTRTIWREAHRNARTHGGPYLAGAAGVVWPYQGGGAGMQTHPLHAASLLNAAGRCRRLGYAEAARGFLADARKYRCRSENAPR